MKDKDTRPLTPEILTAAGWEKKFENIAVVHLEREDDDEYFNVDYRGRVKQIDIQIQGRLYAKIGLITVGEFNTLLGIVKLQKFQIK